jgi:predicted anti-sigma-YlaC factor YlaD
MDHGTYLERIALALYGELDAAEQRELELHLEACAECRRFSREMAAGLGRIAAGAVRAADELPPDWSERLREASRPRPRAHPIWTAVAGFAAGVVAAAMIGRAPPSVDRAERKTPTTWERFHTDAPPPLATTEGQLARLGEYLRR